MKKIVKFLSLLLVMLLSVSQMVWANSGVYMPDFAKASAKVSTKSNGKGVVYIYSQQAIDWPMACVMLNGPESIESCGFTGNPEDISLENTILTNNEEAVTIDMARNCVIDKEIVGLYDLVAGIGTAPTICAKFMAFPEDGYYLKGWSKTDNDFDLGDGILEQCILTEARAVPIINPSKAGEMLSGQFSADMLLGVDIPDKEDYPDFGTYYATFAPVQINGCTGGNIVNWSEVTDNTFNVTFSTSYARSMADFGTVSFDKQPNGGTYTASVTGYNDNEVTIAVTFTPDPSKFVQGKLADGEYKASMTLPSLGGESYVSCLVNVRVGEEANKAVAIGDEKYDDLASALAAANASDELVLLSNIAGDVTLDKNITLNLDGWTLTGNVTVNSTLTLKNGTIDGAVSVAMVGNLTIDGTNINGTLTNAGFATLRRGIIDGGSAQSTIHNTGVLTLEKGAEIIAEDLKIGVNMAAGSTGMVNGAKFKGNRPIELAEGANGVINSAYFNYEFDFSSWGLIHYNVTVGSAFEAGYTHLYAKDLAAAQAAGVPVCRVGSNLFTALEDALLYAQNNPSITAPIIMLQDYTLPAGYYTLPANATLLLPYSDEQINPMGANVKKLPYEPNNGGYERPYPFRKLTLESGVHLDAHGSIETSCMQYINGRADMGDAVPSGPFGWIYMKEGSEILLGDGAHLYAWGFVTGKGTIDARRGSFVHEDFQVYDWPGATDALNVVVGAVASGAGTFPVNQYAMQNVESQITFRPGSRMYASFGASAALGAAGIQVAADMIQIVGVDGDVAMFLLNDGADADNTWVRKHYDVENDQQVWEVNSAAHLGSMNIELPAFQMASAIVGDIRGFDTRNFVLPITSNMKLHLLSGFMGITQNTEFLPGSEMEVNKTALLTIQNTPDDPSDGRVIFMDDDDWKDGYGCVTPYHEIRYSPTFDATLGSTLGDGEGRPNVRNLTREEGSDKKEVGDAKLNVHGTFDVNGYLLTSAGGATIFSNNEDAGTINYTKAVSEIATINEVMVGFGIEGFPLNEKIATLTENMRFWCDRDRSNERIRDFADRTLYVRHNNKVDEHTGASSEEIDLYPALLKNNVKTPEFAETGSDSDPVLEGETYCFVRDRWTKMTQFDDRFTYNNYGEWYVKPAEYVSIATIAKVVDGDYAEATATTQPLENQDHTYSDANGDGRLFIWVESNIIGMPGQWWEVTLEDNLYKGKNGKYYYYRTQQEVDESEDGGIAGWTEKTFAITFLNWDGSPVRNAKGDETIYSLHYGDNVFFNGTNPTRENTVDYTYNFNGWSPEITKDTKVTGNATYTATYEAAPRKYTITFLNENGTEIERHFLTRDEMPVCEDVPSKTGYYLQWSPAIGAVTGDAEYRATFTPEKPTSFMITFKNYDGTVIKSEEIAVDQTPACDEPSKPTTSEYTYVFDRWNPAIEPVSQEMTYTAKFKEVANTYAIRFFKEDGTTQIGATQNLAFGEQPVAPELTKSNPGTGHTYTLIWTPSVATVTGDADYTASFRDEVNKYTVTINATGCVVNGAGSYDYGTEVTLSLGNALNGYENPVWSDGTTGNKTITVTDNVTISASASIIASPEVRNITLTAGGEDITLTEDTKVASFNIVAGEGVTTPQLFGAEYIDMMKGAKAYFTYDFGTAEKLNWYAFAVPFKCDAQTATAANGSILRNTHEYDIVEYDGAIRAAQGKVDSCWKSVSGILYPGKLYMIVFNRNQSTITFTGKDNLTYYYDNAASVEAYPGHVAGDDYGYGWNGIANPALYSAMLNVQADRVRNAQVYTNGDYGVIDLNDPLAIAKPIFVQVPSTQSVAVDKASSSSSVAARGAATTNRYVLHLGQDRVFLVNDEMAEDEYVTGQDLVKFGVSTKSAQIWVNRYNAKLCVNHQAPIYDETTYPLGIFAPKSDNYTLSQTEGDSEYEVILMHNNVPVANLSRAAYTLALQKGNTEDYSVVIRRVVGGATDKVDVDGNVDVNKVLINGKLYIIAGEHVYDALGQLVK